MSDFQSALAISSSGMKAQSHRLRLVSENIANADTPGYRGKTAPFDTARAGAFGATQPGEVQVGAVRLDRTELERIYDPAHPLADDSGYYDGSNVDLMIQIADAREAQRSYEANLRMFDQARQMSSSLLDLLRR